MKKSLRSIALAIGVEPSTVWRAVNRKDGYSASPELACQIHFHSDGAIPCWTLRSDLWAEGQIPPLLASLLSAPKEPAA